MPALIQSGALAGDKNMALDAQMLEDALRSGDLALRTYAWARPTLSLGYFQKLEEVAAAVDGVDVVRRFTGGGAILHQHELTYSIAVPPQHALAKLDVNDSYLEMTRPLVFWLRGFGLQAGFRGGDEAARKAANCFAGAACPDLVVGGKKIFGSAQRRKGGAILQHGSLLLDIDLALWQAVFGARLGDGYTSVRGEGFDPGLFRAEGLAKAYQQAWRVPFQNADLAQTAKSTAA
jgi:lipoate-protein ligase A